MAYKKVFGISSLVLLIPLVFILLKSYGFTSNKKEVFHSSINENILCQNPEQRFGIIVDSFDITSHRIHWNQNLASILSEYNLGNFSLHKIIEEINRVFDVTKFKAGNKYHFFYNKEDSVNTVKYFVYEHSPLKYVKVNFNGDVHAKVIEKTPEIVRKSFSGTIKNSLWKTMKESNVNPLVSIELSEIYAWTINFFGLTEGDSFEVIYEEKYVDSVSIGIEKIHTAKFVHKGETFYAIPFRQDSTRDFYNLDGNSLRREFLKAPLRFSRISSGYSLSRMHPILHYRRPHRGIDYAAPTGTPVHAIGDGTVIKRSRTKGAGNYLKIRHNSVYTSGYLHLSRYAKGIYRGSKVKQGDIIGYVGSTGYATGPHLDFRIWKNGHAVNPLKIEAPPVEPVKKENLKTFTKVKEKCLKDLEGISS